MFTKMFVKLIDTDFVILVETGKPVIQNWNWCWIKGQNLRVKESPLPWRLEHCIYLEIIFSFQIIILMLRVCCLRFQFINNKGAIVVHGTGWKTFGSGWGEVAQQDTQASDFILIILFQCSLHTEFKYLF